MRHRQNPQRNGGKDFAALLEHVSHDKLVLWGWAPGVGRAPVSVPHKEFVAAFKTWLDAGAPARRGGRCFFDAVTGITGDPALLALQVTSLLHEEAAAIPASTAP